MITIQAMDNVYTPYPSDVSDEDWAKLVKLPLSAVAVSCWNASPYWQQAHNSR